jgi:hypothetical protein
MLLDPPPSTGYANAPSDSDAVLVYGVGLMAKALRT